MIETLQKLVPWLPTLPLTLRIPLTIAIVALTIFVIAIIWSRPSEVTCISQVSIQHLQDWIIELSEIQNNSARWPEVEPLADRVSAAISSCFPDQANAVKAAQRDSTDVWDVAKVLKTQILIVRDQLPR